MTVTPEPSWIDWVRDFQTLIAGVIGFGGIIYTINAQGKQNRTSTEEAAKLQSESIELALIAELEMLADLHSKLAIEFGKKLTDDETGYFVPSAPANIVFRALLPKLDQLGSVHVGPIVSAHLTHKTFFDSLSLLGTPQTDSPGYILVNGKHQKALVAMNESVAERMRETIALLQE